MVKGERLRLQHTHQPLTTNHKSKVEVEVKVERCVRWLIKVQFLKGHSFLYLFSLNGNLIIF